MNIIRQLLNTLLIVLTTGPLYGNPLQKETIYLSGTDNMHTRTWEFFCTGGRKSGVWTTIQVPSQWEQQGFGEYDYGRDYRTYGKTFRFADEKGLYRYSFHVPPSWKNRQVFIVFEGSMTDTEVKINGKPAGEIHQGAFYRFRYDITGKLNFGNPNLLEVTVSKMSSEPSVNRAERYADYWVFGGIYRPVYLESFPGEYIERVAIDAKADGSFAMDVFPGNLKKEYRLEAVIKDRGGHVAAEFRSDVHPSDSMTTVTGKLNHPDTWTAETPSLYSVRVILKNGQKEVFSMEQKFGFRTIEIRKGDGIFLNGVKIKMKGINRHAFWPETGRCLNDSINLEDVKLIRSMNMNAVRCSHYPPDQIFLDYCDSLGLYVLDELAGWQNYYATVPGRKLVREMVIRDLNHPSVIFWDNGNEGGTNKELDNDFAVYDKSNRPVIHPHHRPGNDFNGIDCNHYENYYSCKKILSEGKIYMPTEFLHSQDDGGGAASLGDFWELFWNTPNSGGGFTWALLDEGIVRTDLGGAIDVNRVNAPDGIVGPHREKEGSFYAFREIYSPVKINLKSLTPGFNGQIPVENRYHFTNLKNCRFEWSLVNFSKTGSRCTGHRVIRSGKADSPDVLPSASGILKLDLPDDFPDHDALYLEAFNPGGEQIFRWSWKINGNLKAIRELVQSGTAAEAGDTERAPGNAGQPEISENDTLITLKASGISVSFSKIDGTIRNAGNEKGLPLPFRNGPVLASGKAQLTGILQMKTAGSAVLSMNYTGDLKNVTWKMHGNGWLEMNYEYQVDGARLFTGISFDFPESDIIGVKWLGQGPSCVWKNRQEGGILDVYERLYNNKLPADNTWGPLPFKGYYPDVSWMEFNTVDGKFTVAAAEEKLFIRLFDFYGLSGPVNYPALPPGNISFLDAIPPVGTKLAMGISNDTWNLGPSGELTQMGKPAKRTLFFYFGLL